MEEIYENENVKKGREEDSDRIRGGECEMSEEKVEDKTWRMRGEK